MPARYVHHLAREEVMTMHEIARLPGKGLLDVYIPLFFLIFRGRISLWQEASFGQIFAQASRAEE